MANIVVAFPKIDDAKSIKNLLVKSGFAVNGVCSTGAQALSMMDDLDTGIIISAYRLPDMIFRELLENKPLGFELMLMASKANIEEVKGEAGIVAISMPLKINDLINTVDMMCSDVDRKRRRAKLQPKKRNPEEQALIQQAKNILMDRNHMSEEEAHRYMQKCSMDSGTNLVETAHMILDLMK